MYCKRALIPPMVTNPTGETWHTLLPTYPCSPVKKTYKIYENLRLLPTTAKQTAKIFFSKDDDK